jgi:hypothetical protein
MAGADDSSMRGFTLRFPRRDLALVVGSLVLATGGTLGGLNMFGSAKAESPPAADLSELKAEIAGMHADLRALMSNQSELREDVREVRAAVLARGGR